ncbi:bifunctional glycosyltransferase family 2/GtrA family protein [Gorillibacterium massiliense]|uniref:bifunctional glycosyltransferase family 2/GtrA family protein n=1 Tax=Gorillibacterium massiliense TaxID=1280390 RepID=UPI0004B54495|nr:bifunctional glycosyltransferase family 2/GtrA family protein [Gorillibacterium massiliense]
MTILIPSYEPDTRLLGLIGQLKAACDAMILIVDDGSGPAYQGIFDSAREAGCTVLTHQTNLGKGRALKTGFSYLQQNGNTDAVVCADSDGQHLPKDILRIAAATREHPQHVVLGSRHFTGNVPARSRFGNNATRMVYACTTGTSILDTQTGLRGYSADMLLWLCRIPGERFEYEMNMLLEAKSSGYPLFEVPIDTVYLDENKSSHFRPLADSARVYFPFLKFSASSGFSALLDFVLLFLFQWIGGALFLSVTGARLCSSVFNYTMNRTFVFSREKENGTATRKSLPRYYALVILIALLNYVLMHIFYENLSIPLLTAKLVTEAALFLFSYWSQRKFVY